jgi:MOSC domain-containing protein YiiM
VIRVESVNVGKPLPGLSTYGVTGIDKKPQRGRIPIGPAGLAGDHVVDTVNHGGPDQAVYAYCIADYDWWVRQGRRFWIGAFGENLTLSGIATADVAAGDRLVRGDLVLEVTSPRIPCRTLAHHVDDRHFVAVFMKANRSGFYMRVIAEGDVGAGDVLEHVPHPGDRVTIRELVETYPYKKLDAATVARFRAAPLHHKELEELARLYG